MSPAASVFAAAEFSVGLPEQHMTAWHPEGHVSTRSCMGWSTCSKVEWYRRTHASGAAHCQHDQAASLQLCVMLLLLLANVTLDAVESGPASVLVSTCH